MTRSHSPSKPHSARGKTGSSSRVVYAVAIGSFCLVAVILTALWLWREGLSDGPDIAYTQFGPLRVTNKGYAMLTTLSLQTSVSDARLVKQNIPVLQQALEQALADTDMPTLRNPNSLEHLQDRLEQAANAALPASHVQHVFITDLVYQSENE